MTTGEAVVASSDELCYHCNRSRAEHRLAELDNLVRHAWTSDGSLRVAEPPRPEQPAVPRVIVAQAADVQLRALLLAKGVITDEDLGFAPGTGNVAG
jgi:hypothetical protein